MKKSKMFYSAVLLSASLFALWGCPKKTDMSAASETRQGDPAAASGADAYSEEKYGEGNERAAAIDPYQESAAAQRRNREEMERLAAEGLKPVYFDFDQAILRDDARAVIAANAAWLRAHPGVRVRIEGNCDERGTKEYNLALGQRRAASVRRYLTALGIAGTRVALISYGKEKPLCTAQTEACRQKNRRGEFAVASD